MDVPGRASRPDEEVLRPEPVGAPDGIAEMAGIRISNLKRDIGEIRVFRYDGKKASRAFPRLESAECYADLVLEEMKEAGKGQVGQIGALLRGEGFDRILLDMVENPADAGVDMATFGKGAGQCLVQWRTQQVLVIQTAGHSTCQRVKPPPEIDKIDSVQVRLNGALTNIPHVDPLRFD